MTTIDLVSQALQAVERGQAEMGAQLMQQHLHSAPGDGRALQFLAYHHAYKKDWKFATYYFERALLSAPDDVRLHQQLGAALNFLVERGQADAELEWICQELGSAYTSRLFLGHVRARAGDADTALCLYLQAIKTAQAGGFWFDADSTPPWLRSLVTQAMAYAERGRRELFHSWLTDYHALYGRDEMGRLEDCMAMYLDIKPRVIADPRQQPGFLYFPGLPVRPVFARNELPFADWYEAQTEGIKTEMLGVLHSNDGVQPFRYELSAARRAQMTVGAAWDAYFFFKDGVRSDKHHQRCPQTSEVLRQLPLDHIREHGPETCFSIMRPGAHILPHRGVTNIRSVLHLGLQIPPNCALNLTGIEHLHWQPGRCFAFDDTYEHEAWNRSEQTRVVLLTDIWNPFLRPAEKLALADLVAKIGDFNRASAAPELHESALHTPQ